MSDIGSAEGDVVAYCTKEGHGTRLMPEGTIQGMQLLSDGEAFMMTGIIDQTKLNIVSGDFGGELDSGGQDGVRCVPRDAVVRKLMLCPSVVTRLVVSSTRPPSRQMAISTRPATGPSKQHRSVLIPPRF